MVGRGRPLRRLAGLHAANPSAHSLLALARGHPAGFLLRRTPPARTPSASLIETLTTHAVHSRARKEKKFDAEGNRADKSVPKVRQMTTPATARQGATRRSYAFAAQGRGEPKQLVRTPRVLSAQ